MKVEITPIFLPAFCNHGKWYIMWMVGVFSVVCKYVIGARFANYASLQKI